MNWRSKIIKSHTAVYLAAFMLYTLFFVLFYSYHLFFTEQMQLFMLTWLHFKTYLLKPAFISAYLGDFLVQFYYLQYLGPLVIAAVLTFSGIAFRAASVRITENSQIWFFMLPSLGLFFLHLFLDYPLANSISFILGITAAIGYMMIRHVLLRRCLVLIILPVLYYAIGSGLIVFIVFVIFNEVVQHMKSKWTWMFSLILLAAYFTTIYLLRIRFGLTMWQAIFYPAYPFGPPVYLLLMPLTMVVGIVIINLTVRINKLSHTLYPEISVFLTGILIGTYLFASFSIEKILALDSELYFNRHEKALKHFQHWKPKGTLETYYFNILNSSRDSLPHFLLKGATSGASGLFLTVDNRQNYLTITMSNEVYYHIGDVNASQHSALLGTIFSPKQQSSRLMRRLVEINIINREFDVAAKYLKMLNKTLFHQKWAKHMKQYLHNEPLCAATPWIIEKRSLLPETDVIRRPNDHETALFLLLKKNPFNQRAYHYLMGYHLLNKRIDDFANAYFTYHHQFQNIDIPRVYQEALLIYHVHNSNLDIWRYVNIDKETVLEFNHYSESYQLANGRGLELKEQFGNSYWFYFHFAVYAEN